MPFMTEPTEAECFEAEQELLFDVHFRQLDREIRKMIEQDKQKGAKNTEQPSFNLTMAMYATGPDNALKVKAESVIPASIALTRPLQVKQMLGRRTASYRLRQYADNPRKEFL